MSVSYDTFADAFLSKISEYDFITLRSEDRTNIVDGYMKRSIAAFKKICKHDLSTTGDDIIREFTIDIPDEDIDELADIISEGMLVQWMKPYVYKQDGLENLLNTRDFTSYSPAELLSKVTSLYRDSRKNYTNMMREYSYNHGDLSDLHL